MKSEPCTDENWRAERSYRSLPDLITLVEQILYRNEGLHAASHPARDKHVQREVRRETKEILVVVKL